MGARGSSGNQVAAASKGSGNRLSESQSPYLRQHADQPVHWMPWGEEAFQIAKERDCPVFLSVGYSTCHWCHVMARESFENSEVANLLNEHFVSIKVDKEERPDVDKLYMMYLQATQGVGGWPMSVFLTPEKDPIFAGTYFPVHDSPRLPGFISILKRIFEVWSTDKDQVRSMGQDTLRQMSAMLKGDDECSEKMTRDMGFDLLNDCAESLMSRYDSTNGGFGPAPKFPRPCEILALLAVYRGHVELDDHTRAREILSAAEMTLQKMDAGGMHDHLGGGFHRYSVDELYHVPHFEIMLYDQPQLAEAYLQAFQLTGDTQYAVVVRGILDYVLRNLVNDDGGYLAAEDADSVSVETGGEKEGAFYVWSSREIDLVLGKNAEIFKRLYGVQKEGNCKRSRISDPHGEFRGMNVLYRDASLEKVAAESALSIGQFEENVSEWRQKLFERRKLRPAPHRDDKIVTAWNGMMIGGMAQSGRVLESEDPPVEATFPVEGLSPGHYIDSAKCAANFLRDKMQVEENGALVLYRTYISARSNIRGFSDDYAWTIKGLLDLFEADGSIEYLEWASKLQQTMDDFFWDKEESRGYFQTEESASIKIRLLDDYDGAEPAASSIAAYNLWKLGEIFDSNVWREKSLACVRGVGKRLLEIPVAMPQMCLAASIAQEPTTQIVIVGDKSSHQMQSMVNVCFSTYCPSRIVIQVDIRNMDHQVQFWKEANPKVAELAQAAENRHKTRAYVCQKYVLVICPDVGVEFTFF